MAIRTDCTIVGHEKEWAEYRPLRFKDRLRFQNAIGEVEIWEAVRDCIVTWNIRDEDDNEVAQPSGIVNLEDLGELSEPMYAWLISTFSEVVIVGRQQAQSPPSSEQSD